MSTTLTDCPYCERRVLSNNGICPSCSNDITGEAALHRHLLKRKATAFAVAARAKGASFGEIESQLVKDGIVEDLLKEIVTHVEGRTPEAMTEKNLFAMRHGLYWLLGGISVSVVTYLIVRSSKNSGVYVIAYGAILAGAIQFMRGLLNSRRRN